MPSLRDRILHNSLDLESYGNSVAQDIGRALEDARSEITKEIIKRQGKSLTFTQLHYQEMLSEIDQTLLSMGSKYEGFLTEAQKQSVRTEFNRFTRQLRTHGKKLLKKSAYRLPLAQIKAIQARPVGGKFLADWVKSSMDGLGNRIRTSLTNTVITGKGADAAARRLVSDFDMTRKGARALARTTTMQAGADSREEVFKEQDDLIVGYRYIGTLDSRICKACAPWDGEVRKTRAELPDLLQHVICRCQVVPVTPFDGDEEDDLERPSVVSEEKKTVRHRKKTPNEPQQTSTKFINKKIKRVPAKTKFKDWFETQPETWKKEWLGKSRYSLYQKGKIGIDDLAENQRVIPVQELQRRAGLQKSPGKPIPPTTLPEIKPMPVEGPFSGLQEQAPIKTPTALADQADAMRKVSPSGLYLGHLADLNRTLAGQSKELKRLAGELPAVMSEEQAFLRGASRRAARQARSLRKKGKGMGLLTIKGDPIRLQKQPTRRNGPYTRKMEGIDLASPSDVLDIAEDILDTGWRSLSGSAQRDWIEAIIEINSYLAIWFDVFALGLAGQGSPLRKTFGVLRNRALSQIRAVERDGLIDKGPPIKFRRK